MPSDTRITEQRTFSISIESSESIDKFAAENNMSKSMVVEKAVEEYIGGSQSDRIEEKLDQVLDRLNSGRGTPSPPENSGEKENVSGSSSGSSFDPSEYDPETDRPPLDSDEVKALINNVDEPIINPDHIDKDESLSLNSDPKAAAVAAIIRYEFYHKRDERILHEVHVRKNFIPKYIGTSDYILDSYEDTILDHFEQIQHIKAGDDGNGYEKKRIPKRYLTDAAKREYHQSILNDIEEAIDNPVYKKTPVTELYSPTHSFLRAWLSLRRSYLVNADIATDDEIDRLREGLQEKIDEIDESIDQIRDVQSGYNDTFEKPEAINALPYNEQSSQLLFELLKRRMIIMESRWGDEYVLAEDNIIREE